MYSLKQHLAYNHWANCRLIESLQPVDENLIFAELKNSFPGIGKTIMHISDAQIIWLKRLQGESLNVWPSSGRTWTKNEILNTLLESSQNITDFVQSKDETFLKITISYKNMKGDKFNDKVEGLLYHVVNHSTYHRGQVITMLHESGVTTVHNTDIIYYLRSIK
jgi:uncharacterized damage-inducible protein DinB